jgi:hypothetical protein
MKKFENFPFNSFLIFAFTFLFSLNLFAQKEYSPELLFPEFKRGIITFTNGSVHETDLNYVTTLESMVIKEGEKYLLIRKTSDITMISIDGRLFLRGPGTRFYEQIETQGIPFYVQHRKQIISQGKAVAYGVYSATAAVSGAQYETVYDPFVDKKVDQKFEMKSNNLFHVKQKQKFVMIQNQKRLASTLGVSAKTLEAYMKANSLNCKSSDDLLVVFNHFAAE